MLIFMVSEAAASVDISIGANVWYNWWNPPWSDGNTKIPPFFSKSNYYPASIPLKINNFNIKPAIMAGPILSIKFRGNWNLSTVAVLGKYIAQSAGPTSFFAKTSYTRDILKYDSDTTLSYNFTEYIKGFLGFKFQGYRYGERINYIPIDNTGNGYTGKAVLSFMNYGPGIGLGLTVPVHNSLYLLYNLSGSFLFCKNTFDFDSLWNFTVGTNGVPELNKFSTDYLYSIAGNTSLSLAYYVDKANLTMSLGGRYQVLYYLHKAKARSFIYYNRKYDHFYGISFSVIYSFKIGRDKKG